MNKALLVVGLVVVQAFAAAQPSGAPPQEQPGGTAAQGTPAAGGPTGQAPGAAPAGQAPAAQPAGAVAQPSSLADQTWRDAHILWIASQLSLTADQARQVTPVLVQLGQQLEAGKTLRQQLWQQAGEAATRVVQAWIAGREPNAVDKALADDAAAKAAAQEATEQAAIEKAAQDVLAVLTATQRQVVEDADDALRRQELEAEYDGAPSLADYIAAELDSHRALMPDEYNLLREVEASRLANLIVDPTAPQYSQVREAVLQLLDQVANWDDLHYSEERPGLPDKIRAFLQLTEDPAPKPIQHQTFLAWIRDPRTAQYMAIYGTVAQPPAQPEPAKPDELSKTLHIAQIVTILNTLNLDLQQLRQVQTIVERAAVERTNDSTNTAALLAAAAPQLISALPYLITGQPLTPEWIKYFRGIEDQLRTQQDATDQAMTTLVAALSRVLYPQQLALVDWRVPPAIEGKQAGATRTREKRRLAQMVGEAIELTEGLRPLIQVLYLQLRIARIEQFLSQYIRPDHPMFVRARDEIGDIITEARGIPQEQWEQAAPEVAMRILDAAGQLQRPRRGPLPTNRLYDWQTMRDLLLAEETPELVRAMIASRQQAPQ